MKWLSSHKVITISIMSVIIIAEIITLLLLTVFSGPKALTVGDYLELGEKYLLEMNYEQALVQFLAVIDIEPRNPRGYTGAADAYIGLDDLVNAQAILERGLKELPGNAVISDMIEDVQVSENITSSLFEQDINNEPEKTGADAGLNTLSAGSSHSMAIADDGSLWVWGENYYGQIGDGTVSAWDDNFDRYINNNRYTPVKVMDDVIAISAGGSHSMAIKSDGSLWAWGGNYLGQIGDGTVSVWDDDYNWYTNNDRYTPVKVMDDVMAISAGGSHSMAIKSDGSLWAWGGNYSGLIGDGTVSVWDDDYNWYTNNDRYTPVKIMDDVMAISAGGSHSMAIKNDGSLWAWGGNYSGLIGDGTVSVWDDDYNWYTNNDRYTPVKVMDDVMAISAGSSHSMAIKSDGSLWAWGGNYSGQIGDGTVSAWDNNFNRYINNDRYTPVKVMDDVIAISAGSSHSMAMKSDGSLWAWGSNDSGQIGDGTTSFWDDYGNYINNDRYTPVKVMDDVMAISAGIGHSMAMTSDGSLWTWGDNYSGQIGDGTFSAWDDNYEIYINNNKNTPVRVNIPN